MDEKLVELGFEVGNTAYNILSNPRCFPGMPKHFGCGDSPDGVEEQGYYVDLEKLKRTPVELNSLLPLLRILSTDEKAWDNLDRFKDLPEVMRKLREAVEFLEK